MAKKKCYSMNSYSITQLWNENDSIVRDILLFQKSYQHLTNQHDTSVKIIELDYDHK